MNVHLHNQKADQTAVLEMKSSQSKTYIFLNVDVFCVTEASTEVAHTKVKQETNDLYGFVKLF